MSRNISQTNTPDDWAQYGFNKYQRMWALYDASVRWPDAAWHGAGVPLLRPFVLSCIEAQKASSGGLPPTTSGGTSPGGASPGGSPPAASGGTVPGNVLPPPPFGTNQPAAVAGLTIEVGRYRVPEGTLVEVPVYLSNAVSVANIDFAVKYNGSVVQTEGELVKGNLGGGFRGNVRGNVVLGSFFESSGVSSKNGTLTVIRFRVLGPRGSRTELEVDVTIINDPAGKVLTINRIHGYVEVIGPDQRVRGDCDGDGQLNANDAFCAAEMAVQLRQPDLVAYLDGDDRVTSRDVVLILQQALANLR